MSGSVVDLCIWILAVLLGLQAKHFLADYALQTPYMLNGKGNYGHLGGISHAALHCALSAGVFVIAGLGIGAVLLLSLVEFVVHYHLDWGKERWMRVAAPDSSQRAYWLAIGLDQFLHQVTYLALVCGALMMM